MWEQYKNFGLRTQLLVGVRKGSMGYILSFFAGWMFWSLSHYVGHRKWHKDILLKKPGVATHGENQHHVLYDNARYDAKRDPFVAFISFPFESILPIVILVALGYGYIFGAIHGFAFFLTAFLSMLLDDRAHRSIHRADAQLGIIRNFQIRHDIHHRTHVKNFAFISGVIWDIVFRTLSATNLVYM